MDYIKIHDSIIEKAVQRSWSKQSAPVVTENHHILPKSMGGSNDQDNLVGLTLREHYLVHKLLYKIHQTKEMAYAWIALTRMNKPDIIRCSSRDFEKARLLSSELSSIRMTEDNPSKKLTGKNNSRWSGFWHTPEGIFDSMLEAVKATGLGKSTVHRRCKNPDTVVTADRLGLGFRDKTWRELGYWFEEIT